jgi:hypothetical protein
MGTPARHHRHHHRGRDRRPERIESAGARPDDRAARRRRPSLSDLPRGYGDRLAWVPPLSRAEPRLRRDVLPAPAVRRHGARPAARIPAGRVGSAGQHVRFAHAAVLPDRSSLRHREESCRNYGGGRHDRYRHDRASRAGRRRRFDGRCARCALLDQARRRHRAVRRPDLVHAATRGPVVLPERPDRRLGGIRLRADGVVRRRIPRQRGRASADRRRIPDRAGPEPADPRERAPHEPAALLRRIVLHSLLPAVRRDARRHARSAGRADRLDRDGRNGDHRQRDEVARRAGRIANLRLYECRRLDDVRADGTAGRSHTRGDADRRRNRPLRRGDPEWRGADDTCHVRDRAERARPATVARSRWPTNSSRSRHRPCRSASWSRSRTRRHQRRCSTSR